MPGPTLPIDIDATYGDSGTDPSVQLHQQYHDGVHGIVREFDTAIGTASVGDVLTRTSGGVYAPAAPASTSAVNVDHYGAAHDGVTSDRAAFVAAIAAADASGIKRVIAPHPTYAIGGAAIDLTGVNDVTIAGNGMYSTEIVPLGDKDFFFTSTGACSNITFEDLAFVGSAVDDVTAPRRSRTFGANTFDCAIKLVGDLYPIGTNPVISDIRFERVRVEGCEQLPILLQGIRGQAKVSGSYFYNTMDVGWTHCQSAICTNNESHKASDNGFSMSRGNLSVTCVGNTVDLACYHGIWVSGFITTGAASDKGPQRFTVTGNHVTNVGRSGIEANDAPKWGTISGNTVIGVRRGPTDAASDLAGVGIVIGGFPGNDQPNPTDWAEGINVVGNTLVDCARGGILVRGAKSISVRANNIINPGSQFLADGTTAIASSDTTSNFGIAVENAGTVTNLSVRGNNVVDSRATAYLNYGWYLTGSVTPDYSNNFASANARQLLTTDNTNDSYGGTKIFSGNTKLTGGATTGSNSATGTVAGYDLNGAAGSTRVMRWLTAGVARWHLQANTTAEGGSSAGSDLELNSRDDSGTLLHTILRFTRSLGTLAFFKGVAWNRATQNLAGNGAVTIDAATGNVQNVALAANATSSTITNAVTGQELTITWAQDGTGGRTYVWPTNCKFVGGTAPNNTTANSWTSATLVYNGTNWIEISRAVAVV